MWYRNANIRGEYWLTDNGPQYADGDIADDNHTSLAVNHMLTHLGNDVQDEAFGTQTYYNAKNVFLENLASPAMHTSMMNKFVQDLQNQYGDEWWDYAGYDEYLMWLNTHDVTDENLRKIREQWVQREIAGMEDPRRHVSQHYDWVRVQGNNIEVWEMNNLVRQRIKKQIEEIYYDENEDYDENELWKQTPMFNLSVLSTEQYIPNLTYNDLVQHGEKKKEREYEFYSDYRTERMPTNVPGYKYDGG